jgi:Putative peptidoglycan binding domain
MSKDALGALRDAEQAAETASLQPVGAPVASCPLAKTSALEVRVIGVDEKPVPGVAVVLGKSPSEEVRSMTDSAGAVRFTGLDAGTYSMTLPELDKDTWEEIAADPLSAEEAQSTGHAPWAPPAADDPGSPIDHEVKQGDCVSSVAALHGFSPEVLWSIPENEPVKKRGRKENVLFPGNPKDPKEGPADIIHIPSKRKKTATVSTGIRYTVRHKAIPEYLRIRFIDASGDPRKGVPYLLQLQDASGGALTSVEGETDPSGRMEEPIPPSATLGFITLGRGEERRTIEIAIGYLDPIDTITGVQGRLANLGYTCGTEEGEVGLATRWALRRFQAANNLRVTGAIDDATRSALERQHLS